MNLKYVIGITFGLLSSTISSESFAAASPSDACSADCLQQYFDDLDAIYQLEWPNCYLDWNQNLEDLRNFAPEQCRDAKTAYDLSVCIMVECSGKNTPPSCLWLPGRVLQITRERESCYWNEQNEEARLRNEAYQDYKACMSSCGNEVEKDAGVEAEH